MYKPSAQANEAPSHGNSGDHPTELGFLDDYRSRCFNANVRNIEYTGCHIELYSCQADIGAQALNVGITDIRSDSINSAFIIVTCLEMQSSIEA